MLNGWDVLVVLIIVCLVYAIIEKIIMAVLTNKAIKRAGLLGINKEEILEDAQKIIENSTEELRKLLVKETEVLNKKIDDVDKKYVHLVDPENNMALTIKQRDKRNNTKKVENEKESKTKTTTKKKVIRINKEI